MGWSLCALLAGAFWGGTPNQAQAQVTATCPAMSPGDFAILRPDANTCVVFGTDTNPNIAIGNNIGNPFALPTGGILFGAEPGPGLSNVFYNAGSGDVTIPIIEANPNPEVLPCGLNAACSATVFFTFSGVDYSFMVSTAAGTNTIGSTSTPVVVVSDTTPPTITSVVRQSPSTATTSNDTLTFRVTFDEDVQNVDVTDFNASGTTADATSVTGAASVYDVTVSGGDLAALNGVVGLTFDGSQNIADLAGNGLTNTTPSTNQTYTVSNPPELDVRNAADNANILDGSASVTVPLGTDFGSIEVGSNTVRSFRIENNGIGALTLGSPALQISNTTDFTIVGGLTNSGTIAPGSFNTISIRFNPGSEGTKTSIVTIRSDDSDEDPYTFTIQGIGETRPTITSVARQAPASSPTSADTLTFRVTFDKDVQNVDVTDFNASGTTADATGVTGGPSVYDVTVSGGDLAALNGTVGLTFDAAQDIQSLAGLALTNITPGSNESYSVINLPEIEVAETGQGQGALTDGGTLAQGSQAAGSPLTLTFTVTNTGTDTLTLATATASSPSNVTVNAISAPGSLSVAPGGGTTTFTLQYTPRAGWIVFLWSEFHQNAAG
ncbi:choice-of-anchor D domain-containing protein [Aestuariivita sp.]|uniref:choice-of-anchor D domain-containing protein n=1 Tax=Aestuariivita sp. TaxID=1872407 RepID=UPI00216EE752|nr:choice-of-anchor D domain-containing protein [Aestuariivita sp.]MCE8006332.1 choice-of-anchor D domain-containing protein [Aestuariivita sp.]